MIVLAALGDKPWRPCAWRFEKLWKLQMNLARQVGAGTGVSNGWIEYTGLDCLPAMVWSMVLADIASLRGKLRTTGMRNKPQSWNEYPHPLLSLKGRTRHLEPSP